MSGIEVVGLVASVSQLLNYGAEIVLLLSRIRKCVQGSQQKLEEYEVQISGLVELAKFIQTHVVLFVGNDTCGHVSAVVEARTRLSSQLDAILSEAEAVLTLLRSVALKFAKSSFPRKWMLTVKERKEGRIMNHFQKLRDKRNALSLYMDVVQSTQLSSLNARVDLGILNSSVVAADQSSSRAGSSSRSTAMCGSHTYGLIICRGNAVVANGDTVRASLCEGEAARLPMTGRHVYEKILISENAKVHDGNIGAAGSCGHQYRFVEASGGRVKNGDCIDVETMMAELNVVGGPN